MISVIHSQLGVFFDIAWKRTSDLFVAATHLMSHCSCCPLIFLTFSKATFRQRPSIHLHLTLFWLSWCPRLCSAFSTWRDNFIDHRLGSLFAALLTTRLSTNEPEFSKPELNFELFNDMLSGPQSCQKTLCYLSLKRAVELYYFIWRFTLRTLLNLFVFFCM